MKQKHALPSGSPRKKKTRRKTQIKKDSPLEVKGRHLIIKGEHRLRIEDGFVDVPGYIMDDIGIEHIPVDLTLRFQWGKSSNYPMNGFQAIEIYRRDENTLLVRLSCLYLLDEWTDPVSAGAWKSIMTAAAEIESEDEENPFVVEGHVSEEATFVVTKRAVEKNVEDVITADALPTLLRIERRARAFHFAVAREREWIL